MARGSTGSDTAHHRPWKLAARAILAYCFTMAALVSNWAMRTSFTLEPTGGMPREATNTNTSQSKSFSTGTTSTSGKAL